MIPSRLSVLCFALALTAFAGAARAVPAHEPDDMALGSPKAPVSVIEYASVGCPHCAAWAKSVFPAVRSKYIQTGKVRWIVREMLTGEPSVAAAGFMLARCAGPAKYFPMIDALYWRQAGMFAAGANLRSILSDIAKTVGGMSGARYDACLADKQALAAVNARNLRHANADQINATPTFFVNGQRFEGELTLAQLDAAVGAHRRKR